MLSHPPLFASLKPTSEVDVKAVNKSSKFKGIFSFHWWLLYPNWESGVKLVGKQTNFKNLIILENIKVAPVTIYTSVQTSCQTDSL